ncbi:motility associated factor glycosyltransferase family protein, partial [Campylobacter coli]|uniref:motility associated factor glycosyltransferase family protein n=1 Tax=Campylobacter coli TaxID=195 RepID=UPI000930F941
MGLMMTFTPTQKELFNKNIEALSNLFLKESLKEIKSSKFELILGKDNLDINLKDTSDNTFLYENVIDELNSMLNTYNDKYLLYPVLYFYGFGNGILFKALLQNKNHQHIVVFEKDIEIIWIMFHILDFSSELQSARLMVLQTSSLDIELFSNFCSSKPFFQFSRIYFLELMSHYYERFHNDKPDYVLSLERIPLTSEFFNNDFGEFDKDILFVLKSYVHPHTTKYLQKNNRNFMLVSTYASFINYLKLDDFGYFNMGFSVANMNFLLAIHLKHKNIVLIGQDLAYAKDGLSHTKDYSNLDKHEGHFQRDKNKYTTQAYGDNGKVESSFVWTLFRHNFEQDVANAKKNYYITTYNCTEGGARIEGTIEKPFLWACENLLHKDLNKPFEKLEPLSLNKQNEFLLKAYYKVYQSIKHCRDFSNKFIKSYDKIKNSFMSLQNSQENETLIKEIIKDIDKIKTQIDELYNTQKDLMQILGPLLTQFELNLARIYVLNPKTKEDAFNKSILWIKEHLEFMELVYGHI